LYILVGTVAGMNAKSTLTARERLIAATAEQLWANGYAATSPGDIQRAAGVGQGSMYHHFSGKPDLAAAAVRQLADSLDAEIADLLDAPGRSGLGRALAYLERERDPLRGCRVGRLTSDPDVLRNVELREPIQANFATVQRRLAAALNEAREGGEIDTTLDPEQTAATIPKPLRERSMAPAHCCAAPHPNGRPHEHPNVLAN
jgi:TetR/AcrR family transcriptional repressor of nem operon